MTKIKLGYQLWVVIIVFLFTGFIFNAFSKATWYYAGFYLLDNSGEIKTLLFAGSFLIARILFSFNDKLFADYFAPKYINKRVVENLEFAAHQMNNMSIQQYGRNIGSGKYLSSVSQNFYNPFYESTLYFFYLADMILTSILNLGFFFFFNWILGIIALLGMIFYIILPIFFFKKWLKFQTKIIEQRNNWFEKISQLFKIFNFYYFHRQTNKIVNKSQLKLKTMKKTENELNSLEVRYSLFSDLINNGSQIAFYLISGFSVINLTTNINQIVGLSFFSITNLPEVLYKAEGISGTFSYLLTRKKVYAQFWTFANGDQYPEDQLIKYEQPFESINVQGLSFNYPNKPALFHNFNLTIEKHKKYLLVGNNGSGKSTLTKLLTGFERDYSGNILFNNNIEVKELKQESLCRYFNWVTNKNILLDDTLRNNLALYKDQISDDQIKASLTTMNLSDLNQLDHKYEEGQNGLSVGQVQRLDIARCLLEPKPILVLDEALSNVDVVNQERILNHFLEQKDLTLIVITHHLTAEWQQKFDQVVQL